MLSKQTPNHNHEPNTSREQIECTMGNWARDGGHLHNGMHRDMALANDNQAFSDIPTQGIQNHTTLKASVTLMVTMVNLPQPSDQPARAMGDRGDVRGPRNPHNWRSRFGRRGDRQHKEPTGLLELEALVKQAIEVMERHIPSSEGDFERVMDLLRLQYNLNFIVVCEKCRGQHVCDELIAPER